MAPPAAAHRARRIGIRRRRGVARRAPLLPSREAPRVPSRGPTAPYPRARRRRRGVPVALSALVRWGTSGMGSVVGLAQGCATSGDGRPTDRLSRRCDGGVDGDIGIDHARRDYGGGGLRRGREKRANVPVRGSPPPPPPQIETSQDPTLGDVPLRGDGVGRVPLGPKRVEPLSWGRKTERRTVLGWERDGT